MRRTGNQIMRRYALAVGLSLTLARPGLAATLGPSTEGYDLMRQITSQIVRPNLLLIQDNSGSMATDLYATQVGVDSTGSLPTATWSRTSTLNAANGCTLVSGSYHAPCKVWTYRLRVSQTYPSRMATLKNALGGAVTIITQWFPPGYTEAVPQGVWSAPNKATWTAGTSSAMTYTLTAGPPTLRDFTWTVTFGSAQADPGSPFTTDPAPRIAANPPTFGYGVAPDTGTDADKICVQRAPSDLILKTKDTVNWGLMTFTSANSSSCPNTYTVQVSINSNDTGDVSAMETEMQLHSQGGLDVGTYTPTRSALDYAKTVMTNTFNADPKYSCNRTYAAILVTDGLSNVCNTGTASKPVGLTGTWIGNNGNWIAPCDSSRPETTCDVGSSGYDCNSAANRHYQNFPAGRAEELYNLTVARGSATLRNIRTWVIGVSNQVSPCELNFTAYMGHTDASSPTGDAGFDAAADPYLPTSTGDESHYLVNTTHANYAYFATTAGTLQSALEDIVAAIGAGDYSTSGPSIADASALGGTSNLGFITTAAYPGWKGHMYAYNLSAPIICTSDGDCPTTANGAGRCTVATGDCKPPDTYPLLWDAGLVLSSFALDGTAKTANNGLARTIYTWNPTGMGAGTNSLVPITTGNLGTINAICNSGCGWDNHVVDFAMGNDGNGTARPWKLGAILNSTAAVIGPPEQWMQYANHSNFEVTYAARHPVMWVGSSDGMLHCIDTKDGAELFALIPPDKLDLQKTLYNEYVSDPSKFVMGQAKAPSSHVYGVANSPRFGDVFNGTEYRTLLFISEGPGGTGLHALDVTHPYAGGRTYTPTAPSDADASYGYGLPSNPPYPAPPVIPLWSTTGDGKAHTTTLAALANSWSIPALAGTSGGTNWELVVGSGYVNYNASVSATANPYPHYLRFNPLDGTVRGNVQLTHLSGTQPLGGPWVRNQTFADSTIWSTAAKFYRPDNDVNQGVQLDLQGQVWLLPRHDMVSNTWDAPATLSDSSGVIAGSPLYYSAAVATYPTNNPVYDLYAFSSGSFYEDSASITGPNVGITATPLNFIPALYLVARSVSGGSPTIYKKEIRTITYGAGLQFGHRTQVTAYPTIFVPKPGAAGNALALFLVYDPDALDVASGNCAGSAFVVTLGFDPGTLATVNPVVTVEEAGAGASSGFALAGQLPVVAKSFVGTQGRAYFYKVKNLSIPGAGSAGGQISWWMELQ